MIDIIPIVLLISGVFYLFFGFDEVLKAYFTHLSDTERRLEFLVQRNRIRDLSFALWVVYSLILEASALQGTLGKAICGIKVTDTSGNRLTLGRAVARNLAKLISYLPLALGFAWAIFSKKNQTWHDWIAKTYVVPRPSRWERAS